MSGAKYETLLREALEAQRRAHEASDWPRSDKSSRPIVDLEPGGTEEPVEPERFQRWALLQEEAAARWERLREFRCEAT